MALIYIAQRFSSQANTGNGSVYNVVIGAKWLDMQPNAGPLGLLNFFFASVPITLISLLTFVKLTSNKHLHQALK